MPASTVIKHFTDGLITLGDGTTPTAVELDVPFSVGDLAVDGLRHTQRETVNYSTRGTHNSSRLGNPSYITGSFSFQIADYSDATDQTVLDFLRATGSYSANISSEGADAEVYKVNITLTVEGNDHGDAADHQILLEDCDCTFQVSEGEPNTCTINFESTAAAGLS